MPNRTIRTPEKGERLFAKLRLGYSVRSACQSEKIARSTYYDWREQDDAFARAADEALDEGTDFLEDKARERAVKESDTLLIFLLKARRPDKYREKQTLAHEGGLTIRVEYADGHSDTP